jgi:hypothetical protein
MLRGRPEKMVCITPREIIGTGRPEKMVFITHREIIGTGRPEKMVAPYVVVNFT